MQFSVYLLYRVGLALLSLLPLSALFVLGQFGGMLSWLFLPNYRRLALRNLEIAFGDEKPPAELRRLLWRHFRQLGGNLFCSIKMTTMPPKDLATRVTVEKSEAFERAWRSGRPIVLVLSHLSSWELFAHVLPILLPGRRLSTIYQRLGNRFIDRHVRAMRERAGIELFERSAGFQAVTTLLRGGGGIGILSDQHAGDQGLWVPFFGRLASTTTLPALLAKRSNAIFLSGALYTEGIARWRIAYGTPIDARENSVESLTAKMNVAIEEQIRRAPEDWFWVHNRWKTPSPNFLLARYKRGFFLPPNVSAEGLKRFRILIRAPNWLGDNVMSVPAVRAIKRGRPDAHVTVAVPSAMAAVWKLVPEVDEILPLEGKRLFASVRAIRRLPRFDAAVLFPNSARSGLEVWLAGIPIRVAYPGHRRRFFVNEIVHKPHRLGPAQHQAIRYLHIARELGAAPKDVDLAHLHSNGAEPKSGNRFALSPGAEYGPAKRWLPERFAEAAKQISERLGAHWILFGTENDSKIASAIAAELGTKCENQAGKTTLAQLIDQLRGCRLLLTNDTGTMHLAALLGIPTVAIFGSTEPALTAPLGNQHIILRHHVECSPCFLRECPIDFRCMHAVSVEEVATAVVQLHSRSKETKPSTLMRK